MSPKQATKTHRPQHTSRFLSLHAADLFGRSDLRSSVSASAGWLPGLAVPPWFEGIPQDWCARRWKLLAFQIRSNMGEVGEIIRKRLSHQLFVARSKLKRFLCRYYVCLPKALAMPSVSVSMLEAAPAAERIQPGVIIVGTFHGAKRMLAMHACCILRNGCVYSMYMYCSGITHFWLFVNSWVLVVSYFLCNKGPWLNRKRKTKRIAFDETFSSRLQTKDPFLNASKRPIGYRWHRWVMLVLAPLSLRRRADNWSQWCFPSKLFQRKYSCIYLTHWKAGDHWRSHICCTIFDPRLTGIVARQSKTS